MRSIFRNTSLSSLQGDSLAASRVDNGLICRKHRAVAVNNGCVFGDLINYVHAVGHIAESGVVAVEEG